MIDLSQISYQVIAMDTNKNQYKINDYIQGLSWEENENEIAMRISFFAKNDKTSKGYLSSLIKPGCLIGVFASDGKSKSEEVARGCVETWNPVEKNSGHTLRCIIYDDLYKLQKSQDNRYYPSGTGTKSAIQEILDDWGIPQSDYKGPNASHGKLVFNNKYVSDIVLDLLDDAVKLGAGKSIVKSSKGYTSVVERGSNKDVYVFSADNAEMISQTISTADLVTRIKVIGQADDDGKRSVDATLNGLTQYGIRQRIYTRGQDEEVTDAQSSAQEILNEKGKISKKMTVQAPDIPFVRKGDLVYLTSGLTRDYYYVNGIQHNADIHSMTMDLEKAETEVVQEQKIVAAKKEYSEGDIVNYHGGTHYVSSYPGAIGYPARAGKAKITRGPNCAGNGKAHPWHLVHTDSASNVYGWVDDGTFD